MLFHRFLRTLQFVMSPRYLSVCALAGGFYFYSRERHTIPAGFRNDLFGVSCGARCPRGRLIESARPEFFRGKRNTIALRPDPIPRQTPGRKREKRRECRYDRTSGEKKEVEKRREKWSSERRMAREFELEVVSFAKRYTWKINSARLNNGTLQGHDFRHFLPGEKSSS